MPRFTLRTIAFLALAALPLATLSTASAAGLSVNNPYRSFSISGYNYGSIQWERTHHGSSSVRHAHHGRGFWLRRR